MIHQEIIRKKRDNSSLSFDEIKAFVSGITDESISEDQVAAFVMANYFNGMNVAERTALTEAMRDSGDIINWSDDNSILCSLSFYVPN